MIITRTPLRISFFGGGTDYPEWYNEHGGAVLATTIDKYIYLNCRYYPPFFEQKYRIVYAKTELCQDIEEIEHPSVRECFKMFDINEGMEIVYVADLPSRSGLGSSSSFAVGLIHSLNGLTGHMDNKKEMAAKAIKVERDILKENVGCQDQVMAAYGGLRMVNFSSTGFQVAPVTVLPSRIAELESHLMLFFTGMSRYATDIAKDQISNIPKRTTELHAMRELVDEGLSILCGTGSITEFGKLLDETWKLKRSLSNKISNDQIDTIYERAKQAGAIGGKLLGAGGGGFILLFVKPEDQDEVLDELKGLVYVPFKFETNGTEMVLYNPQWREPVGESYSATQIRRIVGGK